MKKVVYLLLGIILIGTLNVNAEECTDYLDYVTTVDTIAYNNTKQYNIKKNTEFKMCYQLEGDTVIKFSNGIQVTSIKKDTYKLKRPFDMKSAHVMEPVSYLVNTEADLYTDPSGLEKSGSLKKYTKIDGFYTFGPYVYVKNKTVSGWVYSDYINEDIPNKSDPNTIIADDEEYYEAIEESENKDNDNSKLVTIGVISSVFIIILVMGIIFINFKKRR